MDNQNPPTPQPSSPGGMMNLVSILKPDKISLERFRPNRAFSNFMHHVIKTYGPDDLALQKATAQQQEGYVYIIDWRTPEGPMGRVPPEDNIGGFKVEQGKIAQETYWANGDHRVFTNNGLVKLPPFWREAFVRELQRLRSES